MMKGKLKYLLAALGAFVVANVLCYFYYDSAVIKTNQDGFTDAHYHVRAHNIQAVEGLGGTRVDGYGFNNPPDATPEMADVVCTGSSQTWAENVAPEENYVDLLAAKRPDKKFFNAGVGGDVFADRYLRIAKLKEFFPRVKTIVFEINTMPDLKALRQMREHQLAGTLPKRASLSDKDGSLVYKVVRELPYLRLVNFQKVRLSAGIKTAQPENKITQHEFGGGGRC